MTNHERSRARVLDGNHGIEYRRSIYKLTEDKTASAMVYSPWYYKEDKQSRHGYTNYYYTRVDGWWRVEYDTWLEAFDHIARSRRMLTSKHVGSNYVQEAKQAGVVLPDSQAQPKGPERDVPTTGSATRLTTEDLMPGSTREEQAREALDSIGRAFQAGLHTAVINLFHEEPTTEDAGVEADFDPWYHPAYSDDMEEVEDVMTMSKYDREW